jgi:hypothetical protein
VRSVRNRRDGQEWLIRSRLDCTSRDVVSHIDCPCDEREEGRAVMRGRLVVIVWSFWTVSE